MLWEPYLDGLLIDHWEEAVSETSNSCPPIPAKWISIANIEEPLVKQYSHDFNEKLAEDKPEMSREDLKFMKIMNSLAELNNVHYRLRLPFREDNVIMPQNCLVAKERVLCLKRKLKKHDMF